MPQDVKWRSGLPCPHVPRSRTRGRGGTCRSPGRILTTFCAQIRCTGSWTINGHKRALPARPANPKQLVSRLASALRSASLRRMPVRHSFPTEMPTELHRGPPVIWFQRTAVLLAIFLLDTSTLETTTRPEGHISIERVGTWTCPALVHPPLRRRVNARQTGNHQASDLQKQGFYRRDSLGMR